MTTFKEIRGTTIEVVSTDPTNPEIGQIWYNSSSGTLKGYVFATVNAWSAGGNLNTGKFDTTSARNGTQTAALNFTGAPGNTTSSESYNGTSWTNTPSYPSAAAGVMGVGIQTAALGVGGSGPGGNITTGASFNGSSWASSPSINTARNSGAGFGLQTAAIIAGGDGGLNATESYNGSSWTTLPATLNQSRRLVQGTGTQTAGLIFGGVQSPPNANFVNYTESWSGTSWTAVNAMSNSLGSRMAIGGPAGQTASIAAGGWTGPASASAASESWNGTSWTSISTLATPRGSGAGCGTQTAGLAIGGNPGNYTTGLTTTEEWTGQALQSKTITVS